MKWFAINLVILVADPEVSQEHEDVLNIGAKARNDHRILFHISISCPSGLKCFLTIYMKLSAINFVIVVADTEVSQEHEDALEIDTKSR